MSKKDIKDRDHKQKEIENESKTNITTSSVLEERSEITLTSYRTFPF